MIYNRLKDVLNLLKKYDLVVESSITADPLIEQVTYDSKSVTENTLFICKGVHFKEEYLESAMTDGAVCYISAVKYEAPGDYIIVSDIRLAMGLVVNQYFGNLHEQIKLVGITGTKGKSTTTLLVREAIDAYLESKGEKKSGVLCSLITYDGVAEKPSNMTTKEPVELYTHLKNAVDSKIPYLTMEISSQALKYERIFGIEYEVGCFLNIGKDHVSKYEHSDEEDYLNSKLKLFQRSKTMCVNLDSDNIQKVLSAKRPSQTLLTFSKKNELADFYAFDIEITGFESKFKVKTPVGVEDFLITLPGDFNIENALASVAVCYALGIPFEFIKKSMLKTKPKGRMEVCKSDDGKMTVIVDYAHNQLSFQALFKFVSKEFADKKIAVAFGCSGSKAVERRRQLGTIADKYADAIYLTEMDCGDENVIDICKEIASYIHHDNYQIFPERGDAIKQAITDFKGQNVLILVLGKGDEAYQKRGAYYVDVIPDMEHVRHYLNEYNEGRL